MYRMTDLSRPLLVPPYQILTQSPRRAAETLVDEVVPEAASTADEAVAEAASTAVEVVPEAAPMADVVVAEATSVADEVVVEAACTAADLVAEAACTADEAVRPRLRLLRGHVYAGGFRGREGVHRGRGCGVA